MSPEFPPIPAGFDSFWQDAEAEAEAAALDWSESPGPLSPQGGHDVSILQFRGMAGNQLHGWIARPVGAVQSPAFLWLPPYSRWSMKPNQYGTRPGWSSLSLNFFGESSFHEEAYTPARGYFAEGVLSPETWIFRSMFQNSVLLARIAHQAQGIKAGPLGAMGMSQGGGMSIWLGAFCRRIGAVAADMPFLGNMPWVLSHKTFRYPLKELIDFVGEDPAKREALERTLSFYDTVSMASRCRVPTLVTAGLKDPAVRPDQVRMIFEALPGKKAYQELDWGHDWHPSSVASNQAWLESALIG